MAYAFDDTHISKLLAAWLLPKDGRFPDIARDMLMALQNEGNIPQIEADALAEEVFLHEDFLTDWREDFKGSGFKGVDVSYDKAKVAASAMTIAMNFTQRMDQAEEAQVRATSERLLDLNAENAAFDEDDIPEEFDALFENMIEAANAGDDMQCDLLAMQLTEAWQSDYEDAPQGKYVTQMLAKMAKQGRDTKEMMDHEYETAPAEWADVNAEFANDDEDDDGTVTVAPQFAEIPAAHDVLFDKTVEILRSGEVGPGQNALNELLAALQADDADLTREMVSNTALREVRRRDAIADHTTVPAAYLKQLDRIADAYAKAKAGMLEENYAALASTLAAELTQDPDVNAGTWSREEVVRIASARLKYLDEFPDMRPAEDMITDEGRALAPGLAKGVAPMLQNPEFAKYFENTPTGKKNDAPANDLESSFTSVTGNSSVAKTMTQFVRKHLF